jgi:hypothetical protein
MSYDEQDSVPRIGVWKDSHHKVPLEEQIKAFDGCSH